jgi:hypothetical protein
MKRGDLGLWAGLSCFILAATLIVGSIYGWIVNLMSVFGYAFSDEAFEWTGEVALRVVGVVFVPLGAVMGWL